MYIRLLDPFEWRNIFQMKYKLIIMIQLQNIYIIDVIHVLCARFKGKFSERNVNTL
jgi:hypothetical protein